MTDVVGGTQELQALGSDFPRDAHRQARTGERLSGDQAIVDPHEAANGAHFVLEELAQGFDQVHVEVFRQAPHVVVALDDGCVAAVHVDRFDHIGIERALPQKTGVAKALRLLAKDLDEIVTDALALELGILHASQALEETFRGIDHGQVQAQVLAELGLDQIALAVPQKAVVDEDAVQAIADGLVQDHGGDRGVDAAGEAEHHFAALSDLFADLSDLTVDDGLGLPVAGQLADRVEKVRQELFAAGGVAHFGVELHSEEATFRVGDHRVLTVVRAGEDVEAGRQPGDLVPVAHPDVTRTLDALQEVFGASDVDRGVPVLAVPRGFDLTAQLTAHPLHPVADAQHGHPQLDQAGGNHGGVLGVDRGRTTGKDHATQLHAPCRLEGLGRRMDLAPGARFAHAASNQLGVLGAEIDDEDASRIARHFCCA